MHWLALSSFILSMGLTPLVAQASPLMDFYWDNEEGFVSAERCQISVIESSPFRLVAGDDKEGLQSLKTSNGHTKSQLLLRSLVRLSDEHQKSGHHWVDVIGVSPNPKVRSTRGLSRRMDNGFVPNNNLVEVSEYILEMTGDTPGGSLGATKIPVIGTFWQALTDGGQSLSFRCDVDGKLVDHVMFNVFSAEGLTPVARVGVQFDQTKILRALKVHTEEEAERVLDSRAKTPPEDHKQSLTETDGVLRPASPLETLKDAASEATRSKDSDMPENTEQASGNESPAATAVSPPGKSIPELIAEKPAADSRDEGEDDDEEKEDETTKVIKGSMEYVVCVNEDTLAVRDESLKNVLFRAEKNESVLQAQSWSSADSQKKTINGKEYQFVKVQFPERSGNNVGWLAQDYVRLEGQCPVPKKRDSVPEAPRSSSRGLIKSIKSDACCEFPVSKRPTQSYLSGARRFKAGRSGGRRWHAACDLYRTHGESAVAVASGDVLGNLYYFYQGTYALEVKHPGGFVARYGELTGRKARAVRSGGKVKAGQTLGYIGTVNSRCCKPMLHFEIYSGSKTGSLTTRGTRFRRRSDLVDPTAHLRKWEKMKFGDSY